MAEAAKIVRKRIVLWGAVQGVGLRYRARHAAAAFGVTGWVRNEYDGTVTLELQGTEDRIDEVVLAIERGTYVRIENMTVQRIPPVESETRFRTER